MIVVGTPQSTMGNPGVGTTTPTSTTANCATAVGLGSKLLGGGALINQGPVARGAVSMTAPNPLVGTPTGWQAQGIVTVSGMGNVTVTAYAICSVP